MRGYDELLSVFTGGDGFIVECGTTDERDKTLLFLRDIVGLTVSGASSRYIDEGLDRHGDFEYDYTNYLCPSMYPYSESVSCHMLVPNGWEYPIVHYQEIEPFIDGAYGGVLSATTAENMHGMLDNLFD